MLQLQRHWRGLNTLVLTIQGVAVGRIGLTTSDKYICQTHGRIADIDNISGSSAERVWQDVIGALARNADAQTEIQLTAEQRL